MVFIDNIAFPEDSELLDKLKSYQVDGCFWLYKSNDMVRYILIEVKHMLNLLYESQGETDEEIITFGRNIMQVATIIKNHCQTLECERAIVRSICIQDNVSEQQFNSTDACCIEQKGCCLFQDPINNLWAIYIDDVLLHCFRHEQNARRVFEYMKRDIRQSSDKWLSVIDGNPTQF